MINEIPVNECNNMKTQTTGLKRKTIDKFYTSLDIVNKCIELIKQHINISKTIYVLNQVPATGHLLLV